MIIWVIIVLIIQSSSWLIIYLSYLVACFVWLTLGNLKVLVYQFYHQRQAEEKLGSVNIGHFRLKITTITFRTRLIHILCFIKHSTGTDLITPKWRIILGGITRGGVDEEPDPQPVGRRLTADRRAWSVAQSSIPLHWLPRQRENQGGNEEERDKERKRRFTVSYEPVCGPTHVRIKSSEVSTSP